MSRIPNPDQHVPHEPWYKFGVAFLFLEMAAAICVCAYSLGLTFTGPAGLH